eukprot:768043-Hanusia_phi.AAC.2
MSTAGHRRATLVKLLPPASIWSNSGQIKRDLIRCDEEKIEVEQDSLEPETCWDIWTSQVSAAVSVGDLRSRYEGEVQTPCANGQFKRSYLQGSRDGKPHTSRDGRWSSDHDSDKGDDELSGASTPLILQISQRTPQKIWSEVEINDLQVLEDNMQDSGKFMRSAVAKKRSLAYNSTRNNSTRNDSTRNDRCPLKVKFCKLGLQSGKVQVVQTASCKCFRRESDESPIQFRMRVRRLLDFES